MKPQHVALTLLVTGFLIGCESTPTTLVAPALEYVDLATGGQSASGHVERDFSELGVPLEQYSFTAIRGPNGTVAGQLQVRDVYADGSPQTTVEGEVVCLTILADGKTARIGARITHSNNDAFVGRGAAWTVEDNGQGAGAVPDSVTDLRYGLPPGAAQFHCSTGVDVGTFGTFGANLRADVQVRP